MARLEQDTEPRGARAGEPETVEYGAGGVAAAPVRPRNEGRRRSGAGREGYAETARRRKAEQESDRLRTDLRDFASARPSGWGHDDWLSFLDTLQERGHDTSDPDTIGSQLERERLAVVLQEIAGLGPRRIDTLVERFGTLWELRAADASAIAAAGLPRALAERVVAELHARAP